jgi:hypothetical protein
MGIRNSVATLLSARPGGTTAWSVLPLCIEQGPDTPAAWKNETLPGLGRGPLAGALPDPTPTTTLWWGREGESLVHARREFLEEAAGK